MTKFTNQKNILMKTIFPDFKWEDAKIHVAQASGKERPIDTFTEDFTRWQNLWNGDHHSTHCWNRKYIFSIIEIPNEPNRWLFGGIFLVKSFKKFKPDDAAMIYDVEFVAQGEELIGRLIVEWIKDGRNAKRKPESMLDNMYISEIKAEPYKGEEFPGHANIDHPYSILEKIWQNEKTDWRAALAHCQGIYLITDISTGMRYVGSAYGEDGIWSRWSNYFSSGGHGDNKLLKKLLAKDNHGAEYARDNFKISLLEQASSRDSMEFIINRESFWKEVLMTRGDYGLNDN